MSDRLAVFSHGRIDQIGVPSEVYEQPDTTFVAGFLGTSNLVTGPLAQRLTGSSAPHTLRRERIRLLMPQEVSAAGDHVLDGLVRDVVFLGSLTRYRVEVAGGDELVVVSQNTDGAPDPALGAPDHAVRLSFSPSALRPVATDELSTNTPDTGRTAR